MKCPYCDSELSDNLSYCSNCGARLGQNDNIDLNKQTDYFEQQAPIEEEKPNLWLEILSFLIPFVGLILFFVYRSKKQKKKAKAIIIAAGVGFVFWFFYNLRMLS